MDERCEHTETASTTATAQYEAARAQVQAQAQRLHALRGISPFTRTDEEDDEMARLERKLGFFAQPPKKV